MSSLLDESDMRTTILFAISISLLVGIFVYRYLSWRMDPFRCSPVTGVVTMNGEPLKDAVVLFAPLDGKRMSSGRTNEKGEYRLVYSPSKMGALHGLHSVQVTTLLIIDGYELIPETIPFRYREFPSKITERVSAGYNTININLESQPEDATELAEYNEEQRRIMIEEMEFMVEEGVYEGEPAMGLDNSSLPDFVGDHNKSGNSEKVETGENVVPNR